MKTLKNMNNSLKDLVKALKKRRKFSARDTQTLIINGYIVAGDRRSAVKDGNTVYPH